MQKLLCTGYIGIPNGIDLLSLLMIHVIRYEKTISHYKEHSKNAHISMKSYQGI